MNIFKGFLKAMPIIFTGFTASIAVNALYRFFGIVPIAVLLAVAAIALIVECSFD